MKYTILVIVNVFVVIGAAFGAGLKFDHKSWDFGAIEEDGGSVTCEFVLTNETKESVVIYNMSASCGCTTPEFSRKPISPGESSQIRVTFDPFGRPGKFTKDIYLFSSASQEPDYLQIVGVVNSRRLSIEEEYPFALSPQMVGMDEAVRISSQYVAFRALPRGRLVQQRVFLNNPTGSDVEVEFRERKRKTIPEVIFGTYYNSRLGSGERGVVDVSYYVEKDSEVRGVVRDTLDIYINGQFTTKQLYVRGLIVE